MSILDCCPTLRHSWAPDSACIQQLQVAVTPQELKLLHVYSLQECVDQQKHTRFGSLSDASFTVRILVILYIVVGILQ